MSLRITLAAALLAAIAPGVHAQSKSIRFSTDTTPNVLEVDLVDGQPVSIGTTGDIAARCVPNVSGNQCADIPTGGGGTPATAGLVGNIPNGQIDVAPGSTIQLTPSSNGAVCLRRSTPATVWGPTGSFGNAALGPIDAGDALTVSLTGQNQTYLFELQCYGTGGASTIQSWQVRTGEGGTPPPVNCNQISPPAGFTRANRTSFTQLVSIPSGNPLNEWPFMGTGEWADVAIGRTEYMTLAMPVPATVPTIIGRFRYNFIAGQTAQSYVNINNVYLTISECPGDFRIPTSTANAPIDDPTFAQGCRSVRNGSAAQNILYDVYEGATQVATADRCKLQTGRTYYFNFILDGPGDGQINAAGTANGCQQAPGDANTCGFGLRYE